MSSSSGDNVHFEIVDSDEKYLFKPANVSEQQLMSQITSNDFINRVNEYVNKNNPSLYILTPCFGSVCYVNYVTCLMGTIQLFQNVKIPIKVEFCKSDSLVSRARNNLIAKSMTDLSSTHFMFIDNDITWDPVDILKLIISNKPLIGGVYPLKHYHWDKLLKDDANPHNTNVIQSWLQRKNGSQLNQLVSDVNYVQFNLLKYNINYLDNCIQIDNNLTKVRHLATGFMMIQRNVIEKMSKAFPSTKYVDDVGFLSGKENDYAYALFDCGVEDGHYYSEDWLFCSRWSKMGGTIWIDVSISLAHTGIEDYKGSYISSIM
jgi:hypothetical protein